MNILNERRLNQEKNESDNYEETNEEYFFLLFF